MLYKIYTDKNENFQCEVVVKNASLKNSIARLILESTNGNVLAFNGKLTENKCVIPIKKLKGLLEKNTRGKMHLEIIVEDTYFKPWEAEFVVEEHTSIKVKVTDKKPKVLTNLFQDTVIPKHEIATICEKFGIKKTTIRAKKKEFSQILKEYFKANPEYNNKEIILNGINDLLL
jgi:hypothetical protein